MMTQNNKNGNFRGTSTEWRFIITVLLHESISFALQCNAVAKKVVDKIARITLLLATCLAARIALQVVGKVD